MVYHLVKNAESDEITLSRITEWDEEIDLLRVIIGAIQHL